MAESLYHYFPLNSENLNLRARESKRKKMVLRPNAVKRENIKKKQQQKDLLQIIVYNLLHVIIMHAHSTQVVSSVGPVRVPVRYTNTKRQPLVSF